MRLHRALLGLVPFALACAQEATGPTTPPKLFVPPPVPRTTVALAGLAGLPTTVLVGQMFRLSALGDHGNVVADRTVSWEISDPRVGIIVTDRTGPAIARVFATEGGVATVIARLGETSSHVTFTAVANTLASTALEIESIQITEFQDPKVAGRWLYAPQIRVKEPTGNSARIVGVEFTIPGIGETGLCTTDRTVAGGQSADVFRETNGNYEVTYELSAAPDASRVASGRVYVVDWKGVVSHIEVTAPVVPGRLPASSSGGTITSPWSC